MTSYRSILAAAAMLLVGSSHAATITFEEMPMGLVAMGNSPGDPVPVASRLADQYLASDGVSFSSLSGYAALVNHGAGNPSASVPNIIGGTNANGALNYNEPITISFFDPGNTSVKSVTSFFKIQGDWFPFGSGSVFAQAFDLTGNLLGSSSDTDDKVFGVSGPVLNFSMAGIHSVIISGDNGTVGFDQLEFGTLSPAIPEPETYALLLAGLAAIGAVARRRQRL